VEQSNESLTSHVPAPRPAGVCVNNINKKDPKQLDIPSTFLAGVNLPCGSTSATALGIIACIFNYLVIR
jgi:hypothetical protein